MPNPYGELDDFLKENSCTQGRIIGWQVAGKDEKIVMCEGKSRKQDLSSLLNFGTQLP
jgi:hypothetical protein